MAICGICGFIDESLPPQKNFICFLCEREEKMLTNVQFQSKESNKSSDSFFGSLQDGLEFLDPDHEYDNEYDGYRDDDDDL